MFYNLTFQCVVDFCQKNEKCPHPGCSISVPPNSPTIQLFKAILGEMFKEYEAVYTPPAPKVTGKDILNITVLNGDSTQIPYYSFMSMSEVQMHINSKLNIPPNKQKILFEDKEVQVLICYLYRTNIYDTQCHLHQQIFNSLDFYMKLYFKQHALSIGV